MKIPYDTTVEKSILSCMFSYEDLDDVDTLNEDSFFTAAHKDIYSIIKDSPRPIDPVMIAEKMQSAGTLESIGGASALLEITGTATTSYHFKSHVKKLHEFSARRHAIRAANDLIISAHDMSNDSEYILNASEPMSKVAEIASATSNERTKKDVVRDVMERLRVSLENERAAYGMITKLPDIDDKFMGLHTSQISVVSAYPTGGKTQMAVQILWAIAKQQIPSLMITIEMKDEDIAFRNLAISTSLPAMAWSRPFEYARLQGNNAPDKDQKEMMKQGVVRINSNPIFWADAISPILDKIVSKIRRYVRREKVKIVAVDYIQLIHGGSKGTKEQEVAHISHTFMGLAKELDIHIMLLSQQNAEGETKYARAIEEDAHLILSIMQNQDKESEDYKKHTGVLCKKDRNHGHTGETLNLVLDPVSIQFVTRERLATTTH